MSKTLIQIGTTLLVDGKHLTVKWIEKSGVTFHGGKKVSLKKAESCIDNRLD